MIEQTRYNIHGDEEQSRICPNCHGQRIWKDWTRQTKNGAVQRFICRRHGCGHRFSESSAVAQGDRGKIWRSCKRKWTDIDFKRRQVMMGAEKHGNSRILQISEKMVEMLGNLRKKSEEVFPSTKSAISSNYYLQRRSIAKKLGNPRLLKIDFHSFRHWKGTEARHQGLDILDIQELLGHKDVKSTMLYVHLEKQVYQRSSHDGFHVRTAKTVEEATKLIEVGFEFIHEYQGIMIYRKRK